VKVDVNAYLGGVASGVAIFGAVVGVWRWRTSRLAPRVTVERGVKVTERVNPPDRYHVWGGNRLKEYVLIRIENPASKPFWFLRGKLEVPGKEYPRWLTIKNEGVPLEPKEATHFQFEMDEVGDLRGATLTISSHGFEKKYRL
jgi:hypothetical protein